MKKRAQRPAWLSTPQEATPTTPTTQQSTTRPSWLQQESQQSFTLPEQTIVSGPSTQSNESFAAVKQMQQAILTFAQTLAAHPVMSMQESGTQERNRAGEQPEYLGGTNAFGNFLVDQYINNANVVGEQFVNIDMHEPERSGTAIPNVNLKGIISTISRVGTPGSEHKTDGIWQTRTNNALKQIYAVGAGLMQLAKDMNVSVSGFTDEDLDKFKHLIPQTYTQLKPEKSKLAQVLTTYIDDLTTLYKKLEEAILNKPELKAVINQDKPLVDHSKQHAEVLGQEALSGDEATFYKANQDTVIPGAVINGKSVKLMDLNTVDAFKQFLQSANVDISKPDVVQKYLSIVKGSLSSEGPGF